MLEWLFKSRHMGYSQWPRAITRRSNTTKYTLLTWISAETDNSSEHGQWVSYVCIWHLTCAPVSLILSVYTFLHKLTRKYIENQFVDRQHIISHKGFTFDVFCHFSIVRLSNTHINIHKTLKCHFKRKNHQYFRISILTVKNIFYKYINLFYVLFLVTSLNCPISIWLLVK